MIYSLFFINIGYISLLTFTKKKKDAIQSDLILRLHSELAKWLFDA